MRNIKLLIEYEGTNYAGWQVQSDQPTVQGTIIEAIKGLTGEGVTLTGASRTDSGVHALGQVANFRTRSGIPEERVRSALNALLPEDIAVREATEAGADFDSRRDARSKTYLYRVLNRPFRSALLRRYSWFVSRPLDVGLMREASRHFVGGEKDFSSFRAAGSDALHSVREVLSVDINENGEGLIEFEVRGTAFLRHMVRIMVGTLVTVGRGRIGPAEVGAIIEARDRTIAPLTAPPQGLFLVNVEY
ncbi:MAG TPA: tRNA pseudouridine(38-40) synthase TruA [Thermodesulfobacteriota bacterium]|nr:tRNA pseudouridine(38-40) synthase TruA [Thermodesulfobacteriota bacterium]